MGIAEGDDVFLMTWESAKKRGERFDQGTCPCCGRAFDFEKVAVCLDTNSVSFRDKTIFLSPRLAEMMAVFVESAPTVRRTYLFSRVWGDLSEVNDDIVDVLIFKLRRSLAPLGLSIETIVGVGWRLIGNSKRRRTERLESNGHWLV